MEKLTTLEKIELAIKRGMTYNNKTGLITGPGGKIITRKNKKGYISVGIWYNVNTVYFLGHLFAWYYTYDVLPKLQIDHKDRDKSNNKLENLRLVTNQENQFNRDCKGYFQRKDSGKWRAYLVLNGKRVFDKTYNTEDEAIRGREEAKKKFHIINVNL